MAKLILTDGTVKDVFPENGTHFSLKELQSFVEGYIEIVFLGDDIMVVNEEGKLNGLPYNVAATDYMKANSRYDDFIVGNALVCKRSEVK